MIANPPDIVYLLKAYVLMADMGLPEGNITAVMATEIHRKLGPMDWPRFQSLYHLYLQRIPQAIARAAWGINEARGLNQTPRFHPTRLTP